ncbi:MAG TPA: VOC family protein [Rhodanobacteraceae bacterium]|nr:VOC family protein [Rhodanobacteraceae bacterium]
MNLPVKHLQRSVDFFTKIGFRTNPGPGNSAQSACFTIGEKNVVLMLFVEDAFSGFTNNAVSDTAKGTEVLFSLGAESRAQVDDMARRVKAAGGTVHAEPNGLPGFMYGCGFCDPDGHRWNMLHMGSGE